MLNRSNELISCFLLFFANFWPQLHTVLAASNCIKHDSTSYAVLRHHAQALKNRVPVEAVMIVPSSSKRRQSSTLKTTCPSSSVVTEGSPDTRALRSWSDSAVTREGCRDQPQLEWMGQSRSRFPNCYWWVLFICPSVTLLLSSCSFAECSDLSTWTPDFLSSCAFCRRTWGMKPCENDGPGAMIVPWKFQAISSTFTPFISVLFGMPLTPGSFFLNTLAPKTAASTLTLRTQHCVQVSHPHVLHKNSSSTCFSGAVILDGITYGKDCNLTVNLNRTQNCSAWG